MRLLSPILLSLALFSSASADVLCVKKNQTVSKGHVALSSALIVSPTTCPSGFVTILDAANFKGEKGEKGDAGEVGSQGAAGPQGPKGDKGASGATGPTGATGATGATGSQGTQGNGGPQGVPGTDGTLRVYGDGSGGNLIISANQTDITSDNQQFENVTINAGVTLTVPTGTIIRCAGSFSNAGTVKVDPSLSTIGPIGSLGGDPTTSGGSGQPGLGGIGVGTSAVGSIKRLVNLAPIRAGSAVYNYGGGSLIILCKGGVSNGDTGSILANGRDDYDAGSGGGPLGGGGGGAITIASEGVITNSGLIQANGGDGDQCKNYSGVNAGACGGGGGGLIHLIAPSINNTGTLQVKGGTAGQGNITLPSPVSGQGQGAGGGGSVGAGGGGGAYNTTTHFCSPAQNGEDGAVFQVLADPAALF
jgi:hypothetical protein